MATWRMLKDPYKAKMYDKQQAIEKFQKEREELAFAERKKLLKGILERLDDIDGK